MEIIMMIMRGIIFGGLGIVLGVEAMWSFQNMRDTKSLKDGSLFALFLIGYCVSMMTIFG